MGHLPVIAETFRITLRWPGGVYPDVHNVFHVQSPSATPSDIAASLDANWLDGQFGVISSNYSCQTYMILPLDGHSITEEFAPAPAVSDALDGQASGEILFSMALCLGWLTAQRGPRGRGRLFLGPVTEGEVNQTAWNGVDYAVAAAQWDAWGAAMIGDGITPSVASYVHKDVHPVIGYRGNSRPSPLSKRYLSARAS